MPVYERRIGDHVAERVKAAPGSDEDARLAALVEAGAANWTRADPELKPERPDVTAPARSDSKDAWVAYAVAQGADEQEARTSTKADLITAYGG